MKKQSVYLIAAFSFLNATAQELSFLAETPPMGWKIWDFVVMDMTKEHVKANSDANADKTVNINIDFNNPIGKIRRLHGTNLGPPINSAAIQDVVTKDIKEFNLPMIRLHDAPLENRGMHVVDVSQIFPLFHADSQDPKYYYFTQTDDYIANCFVTGAEVSFRLGESIEHSKKKYFVHPPEDFSKWADICVNIIRHYNEGWANGFHYNMDYWHIWEEPDNFPLLWTGSWDDFIQLYVTTALKLRQRFPNLKVGGPATMGATGR
jgi:xylan 1,4-beta-xylosidase